MKLSVVILALLVACASSKPPPACPPAAPPPSPTAELLVTPSAHDHDETVRRAVAEIETRGLAVVQRIDHAAAAKTAGLELEPTTVIVFGNPKAGTPLMQSAPTMGLDLPLRILVWQRAGKTSVAYRDPAAVAAAHVAHGHPVVPKLADTLAAVAAAATR